MYYLDFILFISLGFLLIKKKKKTMLERVKYKNYNRRGTKPLICVFNLFVVFSSSFCYVGWLSSFYCDVLFVLF